MQRGGGLASKVTVAAQLTAGLGWAGLGWLGWAAPKPDTLLTRLTAYTRTLHSLTLAVISFKYILISTCINTSELQMIFVVNVTNHYITTYR